MEVNVYIKLINKVVQNKKQYLNRFTVNEIWIPFN